MRKDLLNRLDLIKTKLLKKQLGLLFFLLFTFVGQIVIATDDFGEVLVEAFLDTDAYQELSKEIEQLPASRKEAALALQEAIGWKGDAHVEEIAQQLMKQMSLQLQKVASEKGAELNPWITQIVIEEAADIIFETFLTEEFYATIAYATYGLNFSTDELREITIFYETSTGLKYAQYNLDWVANTKSVLTVQGYYLMKAAPKMTEAMQASISKYPELFQ